VGLVACVHDDGVNVMAAEWTYFLNKTPLYVGVVLSRRCLTSELVRQSGEFSVCLCSESQAELADFAGSFSAREVDKSGTELLSMRDSSAIRTPWIDGGIAAFECALREVTGMPDYQLFVGEALASHASPDCDRPLVKHGGMYSLGEPLTRIRIAASAQVTGGGAGTVRVAATGQAPQAAPWRLTLVSDSGDIVPLGEFEPGPYDDLLADIEIPEMTSPCRVLVERDGLKPGWARIMAQPRRDAVNGYSVHV
jgi:flavin reductase (DIM6/NTAB) family NADH-FMN oxidoreductase RutF